MKEWKIQFGRINLAMVCSANFTLNVHNFFLDNLEQFWLQIQISHEKLYTKASFYQFVYCLRLSAYGIS
jgi:hypothetical protein